MATGHKIRLHGVKIKSGRIVEDERRLDVSTRLKRRGSKRVRVVRKGKLP